MYIIYTEKVEMLELFMRYNPDFYIEEYNQTTPFDYYEQTTSRDIKKIVRKYFWECEKETRYA